MPLASAIFLVACAAPPKYRNITLEGWRLHVREELYQTNPQQLQTALGLLKKQLVAITQVVPSRALGKLKQVDVYISPQYPGFPPRAEAHGGAEWLTAHGRDPQMAGCIEITNVRIFKQETKRMPWFVLHELAHTYHARVLGYDNKEISSAYEQAKASGKYDRVERWHGDGRPNSFERAYAMTNPAEYFAESTEAFFGRNDFYPFNRKQLHEVDPGMEKLLVKFWGTAK